MLTSMTNARSRPTLREVERARAMFLTRAERDGIASRWQEENRDAIDGSNAWVAKNGLPLEKYRMF